MQTCGIYFFLMRGTPGLHNKQKTVTSNSLSTHCTWLHTLELQLQIPVFNFHQTMQFYGYEQISVPLSPPIPLTVSVICYYTDNVSGMHFMFSCFHYYGVSSSSTSHRIDFNISSIEFHTLYLTLHYLRQITCLPLLRSDMGLLSTHSCFTPYPEFRAWKTCLGWVLTFEEERS